MVYKRYFIWGLNEVVGKYLVRYLVYDKFFINVDLVRRMEIFYVDRVMEVKIEKLENFLRGKNRGSLRFFSLESRFGED